MFVVWGPELGFLYNDPYLEILGAKHPAALGGGFRTIWSEVWPNVEVLVKTAMTGEAVYREDFPLVLKRHGRDEPCWFTFSYSPVRDERGFVEGMLCIVSETTGKVLADRRNAFLVGLEDRLRSLTAPGDVTAAAAEFLGRHLGAARAGYGDIDALQEVVSVDQDWTHDETVASLAGEARALDGFGPAVIAELKAGRTLIVEDCYADPRVSEAYAATWDSIGCRALVVAPLIKEGRLRAILYVHNPAPRRWTPGDEAMVRGTAERTWAAAERGRAEAALRESEARLRSLNADLERQVIERAQARGRTWQLSPDLMGALNSRGYFETSNPAWQTVLGWSEAEMASMSIFELLHPDDVDRTRQGFQLTQLGQPAIRFENRYRCKDGTYRWISWVGIPEDGMVYCTGRDVTEEKRQAEELAERTAERDHLWQSSPDLLGVLDFDGVFRRVNPAWGTILGFEAHELVGTRVDQLIHPDDIELTEAALVRATGGRLPAVENRYRHKDGSYRWISWVAAPRSGLIYAIGRHVTAEKAQAEALRQAEDTLRQSQKMEAVGQLTGGLAHDFNNLLAGISGSLQMMQTRMAQGRLGELDRYITAALGASRRAAALTHRLLAFTRRQTLEPKPTDVNRLVAGMEELVRRTVGPAIDVEIVGAAGLWATLVDPNQLENALLNLCINARDAMPDGGRLTVETANRWLDERAARTRDLAPGQYVSLCVSDTGTGMTPEVVGRAFDPFFTTKPIGMGTGLGLSMIYGFVRQSGGQARIYSEPGQGTMVCLYLPRHHGKAEAEDEAAGQAAVPRAEQGETVLVVDDEPTVRMLVADVLAELGYTAIEAADGPAGLEVLQSDTRIDLLVTDVGLPGGMNGRQMADAARMHRPGLKVLFITGYAENAVLSHGHLDPGMHVLTKPFAIEMLASRIKELIYVE
ncbi:PAS domain S-box protein [Belnapia sp. T18]|uniref:histidine kinase n=1 Tax=Belnapia arida TaxID=2804533 RepID=A0ABS1U7Y7_9PROT|nr:PAS domain S-box protein [Belnapia arida]MBL6080655.1 PAS domain S-box protein [Belnapia arida]